MTFVVLVLGLMPIAGVVAQDNRRAIDIDDFSRIMSPGAPAISADGRRTAFVLQGRVYVVSGERSLPVAVTADGFEAWRPQWSADGSHLYFLSDCTGTDQLWRLPTTRFGEAQSLTDLPQGVSEPVLSPDESRLLLAFSDNDLATRGDGAAVENAAPPAPFVVTRRQFKRDAGAGYVVDGDNEHLYVLDIETGALRQLTSGGFRESDAAWSADGKVIVFVSNREPEPDADYRTDIWTVPAAGGDIVRVTDDAATKHSPVWSPDGRTIAYMTAEDGVYGVQHIAIAPSGGGAPTILTGDLDRWITSFAFSGDGRFIYFTFDNAGSSELARLRLRDGRLERLLTANVNVGAFDVSVSGAVALNLNRENDLADVHVLRGRNLARLTDVNKSLLTSLRIGDKRKVDFPSADGTVVEAFITTPPDHDAGRRYPTVLRIHGGPVGQFTWGFDFASQFLAANGYVVVEPNPRGSTGFGQAYIRAIQETWGITDYDDVIAAVDHAIDAGLADPERLAVTGYSYGGYMTNVAITRSNRFTAAASGAGHSLIEANFGHDIYQQWYMWELGPPWLNRDKYDRLSPFLRADRIDTPTLFLGGRVDWNVPILNAELMYQALRVRGVETELVVYPDAHHGGWPEEYDKDYLQRIVRWFDRYLK